MAYLEGNSLMGQFKEEKMLYSKQILIPNPLNILQS